MRAVSWPVGSYSSRMTTDLAQFRACLIGLGPTAQALALPKGYLNGNQADHHAQAQDQGRQDHTRAHEETNVSLSEDRSEKIETAKSRE